MATTRHQTTAAVAKESAPGTSKGTTDPAGKGTTSHKSEGGQQGQTTGFSKAKINVIKTMVFIAVCHVLCLSPMDIYFFYRKFAVFMYLRVFTAPVLCLRIYVLHDRNNVSRMTVVSKKTELEIESKTSDSFHNWHNKLKFL